MIIKGSLVIVNLLAFLMDNNNSNNNNKENNTSSNNTDTSNKSKLCLPYLNGKRENKDCKWLHDTTTKCRIANNNSNNTKDGSTMPSAKQITMTVVITL